MCDIERTATHALNTIHGMRILLVDDNAFSLNSMKLFIEVQGAVVSSARNGKEAIDLLRLAPFDCVLMDMEMPVMGGEEAIKRIRADQTLSHVRVIAMTGMDEVDTREKCFAAGMDDFIQKPFEGNTLLRLLSKSKPD